MIIDRKHLEILKNQGAIHLPGFISTIGINKIKKAMNEILKAAADATVPQRGERRREPVAGDHL
ncbi:MAG: hypothetical protein AAGB12_03170, partial [Pseudomonadota bacterium]